MFPNGAFCFDIGSVDVAIGFHLFTDEACFFDVREVSVDIGANITRNHLFSDGVCCFAHVPDQEA